MTTKQTLLKWNQDKKYQDFKRKYYAARKEQVEAYKNSLTENEKK